jgi:hypothetical protein
MYTFSSFSHRFSLFLDRSLLIRDSRAFAPTELPYLACLCPSLSDVTDEESLLRLNIYDRAAQDQGFLGTVQIKPVLVHDHTVDQWYK